ncbi:diacylglycerol/lipid kinase family protein [Gellertiella hungarica]|uniref:Diacylglycerol kinase family enzyme n=1 Tax=Gellertiella hungarica TaxID=1572859 RepID=A0A7W6NKE5_9HYPH|nr:diacylglycerol kinase family protein [Gellertiella hungarica]MBB4064222.1 diacylglycerol kinase family enzyme [Gellertiella hungarica]
MRVRVVLNRDGGTLKTADIEALAEELGNALRARGHEASVQIVAGKEIAQAVEDAAAAPEVEAVIVGGGDGTVSLAASLCWRENKVLGVLPAGTMNLFARSLGMPLDLPEAAKALAGAEVREADICTVNGHPFVHQVSIGVQPRMVELRKAIPYRSRIGKINASVKAALRAILRPPSFRARLKGGDVDSVRPYSILAVSNNVYGDGHLPFADTIDGGTLGVYASGPLSPVMNLKLARDLLLRRWTSNEHFLSQSGDRVEIEILSRTRGRKMSVDGELLPLPPRLDIQLHPRGLKVLVPVPEPPAAGQEVPAAIPAG